MAVNQFTYKSDEERFMSHVAILSNGCWEWMGGTRGGYARFSTGSRQHTKRWQAHRWAYQHWIGKIPRATDLDHTCHKKNECLAGDDCPHRRCVNPMHMEPVSHAENVRRGRSGMTQSGRTHCPQGHPYDQSNTMVIERRPGVRGPNRMCRECSRQRRRIWYQNSVDHEVVSHLSKTHCPKGHEYTPENTIPCKTSAGPTRGRRCRECKLQGVRDLRARKKRA